MIDNELEIWEEIFRSNEWGKYPPVSVIKFVAKNFYSEKNRAKIKILEIGCGPGANLWFMAREGFNVYGIEYSKTACEIALRTLKNERLAKNLGALVIGDYEEKLLEFEDSFFDAIVDVESLYCNSFNKTKRIIQTCLTKLKPGGRMFSQTFSEKTWGFGDVKEVDYHGVYPKEGPMASKGYARYTTKDDIELLYKYDNSSIKGVERQELTLNSGKLISEWLIEVERL